MSEDSGQIFFKIGDLSKRLGVEPHVLRFWEKEFPQIKPLRIGNKKRLYRPRDLDTFMEIKRLLYDVGFTIQGARKRLESGDFQQGELFPDSGESATAPARAAAPVSADAEAAREADEESGRALNLLAEIKRDLQGLRAVLILKNRDWK